MMEEIKRRQEEIEGYVYKQKCSSHSPTSVRGEKKKHTNFGTRCEKREREREREGRV